MAKLWSDYIRELAPYFLRVLPGDNWLYGVGQVKDEFEYRLRSYLKSRFPDFAAPDALGRIGVERQSMRYPVDTDATYAARLKAAFDRWAFAGTAKGILRELKAWQPSGNPIFVSNKGDQFLYLPSSDTVQITRNFYAPWPFVSQAYPLQWNQFAIFWADDQINPDDGKALPTGWVSGTPADGSQEAITAAAIIKLWKPAHARCTSLFFNTGGLADSGAYWGQPGHTWGDGNSYDSTPGACTRWTPPTN